jgi:hypothetical protein
LFFRVQVFPSSTLQRLYEAFQKNGRRWVFPGLAPKATSIVTGRDRHGNRNKKYSIFYSGSRVPEDFLVIYAMPELLPPTN